LGVGLTTPHQKKISLLQKITRSPGQKDELFSKMRLIRVIDIYYISFISNFLLQKIRVEWMHDLPSPTASPHEHSSTRNLCCSAYKERTKVSSWNVMLGQKSVGMVAWVL
jgi:hypothetical protein